MKKLALVLALSSVGGCISNKERARAVGKTELGSAYLTEGSEELAIETLREATQLDRRSAEAWHMLALAYMRKGAFKQSEKAFKKAARRGDGEAGILLNYAYLLLNLDRSEEAIELLEEAREDLTYRKPALVLNNLGYAHFTQNQCELASARLQEAVFRAPNYCQAWYNLGLSYGCSDDYNRALDAYDRVILQCPEDAAGAWYQICQLEQERGRAAEAIYACRELLRMPDLPREMVDDAHARLQALEVEGTQ